MCNQLMIKEIITLGYLKEGNKEEAQRFANEYKISQYRFSELEKMAIEQNKNVTNMCKIDFEKLLDELYNYTIKEQEDKLTDVESNRYSEIVNILQSNNIEIPFGINV